jgi:hypothetical protein
VYSSLGCFSVCCLTTSSPRFYYHVWYTVTMEVVQNHNTDVLNDISNYCTCFFWLPVTFPLLILFANIPNQFRTLCPCSVSDYSPSVPVNAHGQMYITIMCVFVGLERL